MRPPSPSNVDRVIGLYADLSRRDLLALQRRVSPEVVVHIAGASRFAGTHDGMGSVIALASDFENRLIPFRSTIEDIEADGEDAVRATVTVSIRNGPYVQMARLRERFRFDRDGLIVEFWVEAEDQQSVDELLGA